MSKPPRSVWCVFTASGRMRTGWPTKAQAEWEADFPDAVIRYDLHRPARAKSPVAPPPPGYGCGACGKPAKRRKGAR